jgi:hypothetical protein
MERILSQLRKECAVPVPNPYQHSEIERDDVRQVIASSEIRETATKRRLREVCELISEGVHVEYVNNWQVRIGPLHIWVASGRWMNTGTGVRGKLKSTSIRKLITFEVPGVVSGLSNFQRRR